MALVSVIIPTYNSSRTLEKCLLSLKNQDYNHIEIIIVDNNSKDNTKDIAKKYTNKVYNHGPERTFQKNYGIEKAKGEYLCFIDSDMKLGEKVLSKCTKKIQNKKIGGVCIPERSVGEGFFVKVRDFERSFYGGTSVESARFFRKKDVEKVGGFEEDLIFFEESLLPQKVESKLGFGCKGRIQEYILHDESDIRLWNWLKKKFYYGKSLKDYKDKVKEIGIKETGDGQMSIVSRYTIFLKDIRFYKSPVLAFGVLGLKTLEFASGLLGLLFNRR